MGGVVNHEAYVFSLVPPEWHPLGPAAAICIDGEDPNLSSWCRYFNHAPLEEEGQPIGACNMISKRDARRQLIWFEARRDVHVGEELCFCCAPERHLPSLFLPHSLAIAVLGW